MKIRTLAATALTTTLVLGLAACGQESTPETTQASQSAQVDWSAHIEKVAKDSGEKAFAQVDLVGQMVTLTYLDGSTVMNGAGRGDGKFEYRVFDDYQDTRKFVPLSELSLPGFGKRIAAQQKTCGNAEVTARLTVTATGAKLERLGCESSTSRLDVKATTLNGKDVPQFDKLLSAEALTAVLGEAVTLHGPKVAQVELRPVAEEGDQPRAVVTALPAKVGGATECAQLSTRWTKPGASGELLNYSDCAMTLPAAGPQLDLSGLKPAKVLQGTSQAAAKLGVAPEKVESFIILPSTNPSAFTVKAIAGDKDASVTVTA